MAFEYAPLKARTFPTIKDAVAALKQADHADPNARDVRPLMAILMAIAERSTRLSGHILTRRAAVSSYYWRIKPMETTFQEAADRATIRCREVINKAIAWHLDRHLFGVLAIELNWTPGTPAGTAPSILHSYEPIELEKNGRKKEDVAVLLGDDKIQRFFPLQQDNPASWLIDVDDRRYRGGLLRPLIFHEIIIDDNNKEWSSYNKKLKGIIQARFEQWASKEEKETAVEAMKKLAEHNYSATSKATEFVFNKLTDGVGAASFKELKQELEADRSITILGQANTPSLPDHGGSRAALQVQSMISSDIHHESMTSVEEFINSQLLLHDWRMNANPAAMEAPYYLEISLAEDLDPEQQARVVGYAKQANVPLRRDEVYERLQYSQPEEGDDVFDWSGGGGLPGGM